MERSQNIKEQMKHIYSIMESGDVDGMKKLWSAHEGVLAIGTDPKEWWKGGEHISDIFVKQLAEMQGISLLNSNIDAYQSGSTGWAADNVTWKMGDVEVPMRVTAVFIQENNDWKVAQWHVSLGVANEEVLGHELPME